jgi:nucleoside-diphosphate-sugar epimerase
MKLVVTGHRGFIGSHYLNYASTDSEVEIIKTFDKLDSDGDLCNSPIAHSSPDCNVVLHLAAINGTRSFYEIPTEVAFHNTLPTFNLIDRYKGSNTKFVFASTCEIFNGTIDEGYYSIPTDEQVPIMFKDIQNPRWSYSIPKALGENLVANCGLPWIIIRYFNVYGPGQQDHFLNEFISRVASGEYYINGDDTRSFCYIDDAVAMTHNLVKYHSGHIVNVGRQDEIQISTVAKTVMDMMGVDPNKLEILNGQTGSAKRRCPDTSLVRMLTGFNNYTPLTIGLKQTIESLL